MSRPMHASNVAYIYSAFAFFGALTPWISHFANSSGRARPCLFFLSPSSFLKTTCTYSTYIACQRQISGFVIWSSVVAPLKSMQRAEHFGELSPFFSSPPLVAELREAGNNHTYWCATDFCVVGLCAINKPPKK